MSSAYNVSAGGPLIDCDAQCFVLTPICQHGSGIYPYVVNDNKNNDYEDNNESDNDNEFENEGVCFII